MTLAPAAVVRTPASDIGTSAATYRAQTTAIAAMIPECMLQNIAQPHRNPAAGEIISRKYTYTPPDRGYADASSAQMLAPNHVSPPATIQTASMIANPGADRLTSEGWTKIDAPTIVPTTIATACGSRMARDNIGAIIRQGGSSSRKLPSRFR